MRRVTYAPVMKWFVLETRSRDVARVSAMLRGLPEFARLVPTHAPADAIDRETLAVLAATGRRQPAARVGLASR